MDVNQLLLLVACACSLVGLGSGVFLYRSNTPKQKRRRRKLKPSGQKQETHVTQPSSKQGNVDLATLEKLQEFMKSG